MRGAPYFLQRHRFPRRVLSIRRIRGWVDAEPIRPRVATRGYPEPQLRSSIRMARSKRLRGLPTSTAASQLSPNRRHCRRPGFFELLGRRMPAPRALGKEVLAGLKNHSPLEEESARPGRSPQSSRWGVCAVPPTFCRGVAFRNGCFLFAAFAAGLEQNRNDPGLPPGATRGRSFAAL